MKVMLWNVYNGFQNGPEKGLYKGNTRESMIADMITDEKPDVVGLLELQGFDDSRLSTLSKRWGHKHYILISGEFPMAITSRYPLCRPMWSNPGMVHGFISVEIEKIRMILCHITTQKHGNRNSELRTILRNILPILDNDTPMLLMGDLNGEYADDVPTTFRAIGLIDSLHKEKQKIDYIYHSEAVGNVKVELKKEKAIRKLSDHFPLVALIHNEEDSS